ncbi:hypothetical protein Tco_0295674, partial [Tanacetum coccineum]
MTPTPNTTYNESVPCASLPSTDEESDKSLELAVEVADFYEWVVEKIKFIKGKMLEEEKVEDSLSSYMAE